MYLDFFNLKEFPFNQSANIDYYCKLSNHQESLEVLLLGSQVNDGIIKITGKPGTGKSLLCRLFIKEVFREHQPVYLPNPYISYHELLQTIAEGLKVPKAHELSGTKLSKGIYKRALDLKKENKKVLLIFDEAQALSAENLEAIRILTNIEENNEKLCQIILIGGLELDDKLKKSEHFLQRISFSHKLLPIKLADINDYVFYRISKATKSRKKHGVSITPNASKLLHKKTEGIPRLINLVCHKALMLAYSRGEKVITEEMVSKAISDTEGLQTKSFFQLLKAFWGRWQAAS